MTGGGGSIESSPEAVLCLNTSVPERSSARPKGTVSFESLSKGTDGVEVSSKVRLVHTSCPADSPTHPSNPISEEVPSPMNSRNFAGSHCFRTTVNEPGGRNPGYGRYGVDNLTSVRVFAFASNDKRTCVCSDSAVNVSFGANIQWKSVLDSQDNPMTL